MTLNITYLNNLGVAIVLNNVDANDLQFKPAGIFWDNPNVSDDFRFVPWGQVKILTSTENFAPILPA